MSTETDEDAADGEEGEHFLARFRARVPPAFNADRRHLLGTTLGVKAVEQGVFVGSARSSICRCRFLRQQWSSYVGLLAQRHGTHLCLPNLILEVINFGRCDPEVCACMT